MLEWEKEWWGTCQNTYGEEYKQLLYARKMGLEFFHDGRGPFNIDMQGASVLDIGGGPTSLLLKCVNVKGKVIDPLQYPDWVYERYKLAGISYQIKYGEDIEEPSVWDEVWIYNVLQHVKSPKQIIDNAQQAGKLIRIFEWVDTPTNEGHPHCLRADGLNLWLKGEGKTEFVRENTAVGKCYYGIFPT